MNRDELLKAIMKLDRYDLEKDYNYIGEGLHDAYMVKQSYGGIYVEYEDLIDLINKLYEQSK